MIFGTLPDQVLVPLEYGDDTMPTDDPDSRSGEIVASEERFILVHIKIFFLLLSVPFLDMRENSAPLIVHFITVRAPKLDDVTELKKKERQNNLINIL